MGLKYLLKMWIFDRNVSKNASNLSTLWYRAVGPVRLNRVLCLLCRILCVN